MEAFYIQITMVVILVISLLVAKKAGGKKKLGCLGFGYISLVVFIIGMFAVTITFFLTQSAISGIRTYAEGEKYKATIVSYSSYENTNDDGDIVTMYVPTYEIKVSENEVYQVEDYISSSDVPSVGEIVELYYNITTGEMLQFSSGTIIMGVGMFIMWLVLTFAFVGILFYLFNGNMSKYFKALHIVGMGFFLPFIMIAFEALLIYALLSKDDIPGWVIVLLIIFIIGLGLGTLGYLKMLFTKGLSKWNRDSDNSWSADWEGDGENDVDEMKIEESVDRNKEMIPLNEDLLKDKNDKKNNL